MAFLNEGALDGSSVPCRLAASPDGMKDAYSDGMEEGRTELVGSDEGEASCEAVSDFTVGFQTCPCFGWKMNLP